MLGGTVFNASELGGAGPVTDGEDSRTGGGFELLRLRGFPSSVPGSNASGDVDFEKTIGSVAGFDFGPEAGAGAEAGLEEAGLDPGDEPDDAGFDPGDDGDDIGVGALSRGAFVIGFEIGCATVFATGLIAFIVTVSADGLFTAGIGAVVDPASFFFGDDDPESFFCSTAGGAFAVATGGAADDEVASVAASPSVFFAATAIPLASFGVVIVLRMISLESTSIVSSDESSRSDDGGIGGTLPSMYGCVSGGFGVTAGNRSVLNPAVPTATGT